MHRLRLLLLLVAVVLASCSIELSDQTPEPTVFVPIIGTTSGTAGTSEVPATELSPAEWADLGLTGRLQYTLGNDGILQLDLATGETRMVFTPPEDTWLTSAAASPDGARLAVAYAPPPPEGVAQLGYTGLYALPGDCAQRADGCAAADLQELVVQADRDEAYFSPAWSPDGQTF